MLSPLVLLRDIEMWIKYDLLDTFRIAKTPRLCNVPQSILGDVAYHTRKQALQPAKKSHDTSVKYDVS